LRGRVMLQRVCRVAHAALILHRSAGPAQGIHTPEREASAGDDHPRPG
jgi:hypothetical protein